MNLFKKIIRKMEFLSSWDKRLLNIEHVIFDDRKNAKINIGQLQADVNKNKTNITSLSDVEFQVFSQFGDDGIIQWLIGLLPLPNKTFIEFGVENYRESNTRFLLINNYWSGLIIDGSKQNIDSVKNEQVYFFSDLEAIAAFINKDNINDLIAKAGFEEEVGLLSVDIDGNDYWVWKQINTIRPVIVICEYNALFGFEHPYSISYQADFIRGRQYPFCFFGASLLSFIDLGKEKGYSFIGCNSAGNNAYFIRNDFMQFLPIKECSARDGYRFSQYTESYSDKKQAFARGGDKLDLLDGLEVINTRTMSSEKLDASQIVSSLRAAGKLRRSS